MEVVADFRDDHTEISVELERTEGQWLAAVLSRARALAGPGPAQDTDHMPLMANHPQPRREGRDGHTREGQERDQGEMMADTEQGIRAARLLDKAMTEGNQGVRMTVVAPGVAPEVVNALTDNHHKSLRAHAIAENATMMDGPSSSSRPTTNRNKSLPCPKEATFSSQQACRSTPIRGPTGPVDINDPPPRETEH